MHAIVETERQHAQHHLFQRDDRRGDEQLLQRGVVQLTVEHGEHLAFGHHDVLHGAAVVEQRVVGTVFRIEIDFHRHHEIHGGDQNRQERQ